jgi:hypothetical protein
MHRTPTVDELLVRWHRWASATVRQDDTLIRDFNILMLRLPDDQRSALVFYARNLCCDATVWSSKRKVADLELSRDALAALMAPHTSRWFGPRMVYLNERGNRVGESNPRAVLTDHDIDNLLELRAEVNEAGHPKYSYNWLADKFECSKSAVQDYCTGRRRGQTPARVKKEER